MKSCPARFIPLIFAASVLSTVLSACGQEPARTGDDWPRWRGPNGDGISRETGWNPNALAGGPKVRWVADVGTGYSSVVIQGNRLYALGSYRHKPTVHCLDATTGRAFWRTSLERFSDLQSTPAVDGDRVYGLTREGELFCLQAADGKLIVLELDGTLHIVEATPMSYKEISSADVLRGMKKPRTFATPPVLWGGMIFCRNYAGDLVCIDVSR